MPGRLVGVSKDAQGNPAMRLALGTRGRHIRRDKATSNICTAQVLLAVMASMYAVYHGPKGLREIAARVHRMTAHLGAALVALGYKIGQEPFFDTLRITTLGKWSAHELAQDAVSRGINLRVIDADTLSVSLDETTTEADLDSLLKIFGKGEETIRTGRLLAETPAAWPGHLRRTSDYLMHPVFNSHRTETEMLRYIP